MVMANSIERTGKFYYGDKKADESLLLENQIKKRDEEKVIKEAGAILLEQEIAKQKELEARLDTLEMIPSGNKLIILPYPTNPYRKVVSKGGIFVDYDGSFNNPDTGEKDKLEVGVKCGKVIEVGPDCKWAAVGDDVFYESRVTVKLPFFSLGYEITNEPNIHTFLNEDLKARLGMK
jgi:hypothetical protein